MSLALVFVSDFLYRPRRTKIMELFYSDKCFYNDIEIELELAFCLKMSFVCWFGGLLDVTHWIPKMERF